MLFFSSLHQWASWVFPPVGFVLNILLFYLVWFRTPENMWTQSRLLLQTCLYNFAFLTVIIMGAPVPLANYETSVAIYAYRGYLPENFLSIWDPRLFYYQAPGVPNEYVTFFSHNYSVLHWHANVYTALYYLDLFSVCIQSVYRYLCQNLNASLKRGHYLLLLGMAVGLVVLQQLLFAWYATVIQCLPVDGCPDLIRKATKNNDSMDELLLVLTIKSNGFYQLLLFSWAVILISAYAIIWFCSREIIRFVNGHANLNPQLKSLNRQLTYSLIAMAAFHFLLVGLNLLEAGIVAITRDPMVDPKYVIHTLILSVPVLNPIVCILVNRPYRDAVAAWLCCCPCKKNSSNNAVQPQPSLSTNTNIK